MKNISMLLSALLLAATTKAAQLVDHRSEHQAQDIKNPATVLSRNLQTLPQMASPTALSPSILRRRPSFISITMPNGIDPELQTISISTQRQPTPPPPASPASLRLSGPILSWSVTSINALDGMD